MTNRRINIGALDFQGIKGNLKEFLKSQEQFQDYDFEGSNMSVLLDLLAYNTHYNAMYMNMALNEAYLDSATQRSSVVSLGTALGYTPRSTRGSRTSVQFSITNALNQTNFLTLEKNTPFSGLKDGVKYTFFSIDDVSVELNTSTNTFNFTDVELIEGSPSSSVFVYDESNSFRIPNRNVDLSTLTVRVQESGSSTEFQVYTLADIYSSIDGESTVYFVREIDGSYMISFGDNVLGKRLLDGNIITIDYFVCSGEIANTIRSLQYEGNTFGGTVSTVLLNTATNGGRNIESIEEIRFNAPNLYAAQNRAVTALDFESLILSKVPSIEAVSVWGGENNIPPIYGKVFISAKTASGRNLSFNEQEDIKNSVLNNYKVISVIPEFVNPEFIEVDLDLVAYYDSTLTVKTPQTLRTEIIDEILSFDENELQKFNKILRKSVLARTIENLDSSIISCVPRFRIGRTITPIYSKFFTYNINVGNPFTPGSLLSSGFYIAGNSTDVYLIDDDENGNLKLFTVKDGVRTNENTIGSVDYTKGTFIIENLNITRVDNNSFKMFAIPSAADIASMNNQVVQLNRTSVKVSVIADETTKGRAFSGNKFLFSSNNF